MQDRAQCLADAGDGVLRTGQVPAHQHETMHHAGEAFLSDLDTRLGETCRVMMNLPSERIVPRKQHIGGW